MTIAEFLTARLDEDQAAARAATAGPWERDALDVVPVGDRSGLIVAEHCYGDDADHIARHDPARVLAQVAAMRAIVDEHESRTTDYLDAPPEQSCRRCGKPDEYPVPFPCPTLRHLAAIWSSHPDYDPAWAPEGE